jgi:hypothetical protein
MDKEYQWEDCLGPLEPPVLGIQFDGESMWLVQNIQGKSVRLAGRENSQWVSLFANLLVYQETPSSQIGLFAV